MFLAVWVIGAFTAKRSVRRQSWASRVGMTAGSLLGYYVLLSILRHLGLAHRRFLPDDPAWLWTGLMMTMCGVVFAIWARLAIGRNWSGTVTVKREHELIRTGPYALVRHPIYTGVLLAVSGTIVFIGEIWAILILVVTLCVFIPKIRIEERFMTEQFGAQYGSYREQTKGLVPFLW